ncbi:MULTISPECIES: endonuclease/exonuclease/phosphatase family protein [Bacillales]|jgi:endonuclease/exonuclease/phosphatase family metal-dependent hydrolase|uniref:Metal-dependent hydrolase n=1 Tax=Brevibacillus aydinogluensis TaxID=927786 RepID=A0AA48M8H6_9BACL|nr:MULTISPECIES: endonuclease/exonuclease/phosphatase family protein [Bacillales]MDT3414573.1 endonuclease/exonuclease/phosphatase family metal-dependent hydrolase [Brevibacillus aydinogluensis]CAJ1003208.1 Metal-dependent hydrolase [Brevibacillus aydinogluensis]
MIRVVSYNIHSGRDLFWRKRLNEMAATLREMQADVIGLQEVHQNGKYGFQAAYLADALEYEFAFAPSITIADGHYGNALLTRLPVEHVGRLDLPAKKEKRCALQATLSCAGIHISCWVTHCSLNQASRLAQIKLLTDKAAKMNTPLLLMGDFNAVNVSFAPMLTDCALATGQDRLATLPTFRRRIDYLFASSHWRIIHYDVAPVKWSDHLPIIADLELQPQVPAK